MRDVDRPIRCPDCDSNQVSAGTKGYGVLKGIGGAALLGPIGLLAGAIGSKKVKLVCLNCGKRWKAGR